MARAESLKPRAKHLPDHPVTFTDDIDLAVAAEREPDVGSPAAVCPAVSTRLEWRALPFDGAQGKQDSSTHATSGTRVVA